jgi:hypothetical protein
MRINSFSNSSGLYASQPMWTKEKIIERLAQITLLKGSYPSFDPQASGPAWDARTIQIARTLGGIPAYNTVYRNVGIMSLVRKEIDIYIEKTR